MKLYIFLTTILIFVAGSFANTLKPRYLIGEADLSVLFFDIYNVKLYATTKNFSPQQPFELKITYKRKFSSEAIAEKSAEEMAKIGFTNKEMLDQWQQQMTNIFPDVKDGDSISGVYTPNNGTSFYFNDTFLATIEDKDFGEWFFGIWLNEKTSVPDLRISLLGLD